MGDAPDLAGKDLQFVEVVLSHDNGFVGDVVAQTSFGQHYGCSLLAMRRRGDRSQPLTTLAARPSQEPRR
jgi:hypothetical protein